MDASDGAVNESVCKVADNLKAIANLGDTDNSIPRVADQSVVIDLDKLETLG